MSGLKSLRENSRIWEARGRTAGPSTALPRISCGSWWRWCTSCALLYGRAHTWPCPVPGGRKSGYAPVGMTILLGTDKRTSKNSFSSPWVVRRPNSVEKHFQEGFAENADPPASLGMTKGGGVTFIGFG